MSTSSSSYYRSFSSASMLKKQNSLPSSSSKRTSTSTDSSQGSSPRGSLSSPLPRFTASLSRGLTTEAATLCKCLLNDMSLINDLTNKVLDLNDFSHLLYRYFQVHNKDQELFEWAVEQEVIKKAGDYGSLFRGETLASKFFHERFFNFEGVKYIGATVVPLIHEIIDYKVDSSSDLLNVQSLEIDSSRASEGVNTEENLTWYNERFNEFLDRLLQSVKGCPHSISSGLRYLLISIKNHISLKDNEYEQVIVSVIFLRFFCPALVSPLTYGQLSPEQAKRMPMPNIQRRLIIASKLLQMLANSSQPDASNSLLSKFVSDNHMRLFEYVRQLINNNEDADNSENREIYSEEEKVKAEEKLRNYIQIYYLPKQSTSTVTEMQYKSQLEKLLTNYRSDEEWKMVKTSKCGKIFLYERKPEGSDILIYKVLGLLRADIGTLYDLIKHFPNLVKFFGHINHFECVEKFDDNNSDWYLQTKIPFPFGTRDWLFTCRNFSDDSMCVSCYYSIQREEKPISAKFVRGQVQASGFVLEKDVDNEEVVLCTSIIQCNLNGNVPKWMMKQASQEIWKAMKQIKAFVSSD